MKRVDMACVRRERRCGSWDTVVEVGTLKGGRAGQVLTRHDVGGSLSRFRGI